MKREKKENGEEEKEVKEEGVRKEGRENVKDGGMGVTGTGVMEEGML